MSSDSPPASSVWGSSKFHPTIFRLKGKCTQTGSPTSLPSPTGAQAPISESEGQQPRTLE
ncbi:hypothetical protein L0F63_001989, partial [Massospora cicadina]